MVNTPVKPELTATEAAVLQKAKEAQDTGKEVRLTGEEAKAAGTLLLKGQYAWGHPRHGPHWGPGPYVDGWWDGGDVVAAGITAAGLMVLDSWLNKDRDNEPVEPQEAEPGEEPEEDSDPGPD